METAEYFREKAVQCRCWAAQRTGDLGDRRLIDLAEKFEARAAAIDAAKAERRGIAGAVPKRRVPSRG